MFNFAAERNRYDLMEWNEKQLHILNAAEDLFANKGFEGTSVRDIAQKAEVNVAMISYYFGSKEKLLQNLILNRTEHTTMVLKDLTKDTTLDPWQKIDYVVDYYVDKRLNNRKIHTILSRLLSLEQDKEVVDLLVNIKKGNSSLIRNIIREGQRKRIFKKVDIILIIGTVMGTISQFSMSRPFYSSLMKLENQDDETYYRKVRPKLKKHLKSLLRAHLDIRNV